MNPIIKEFVDHYKFQQGRGVSSEVYGGIEGVIAEGTSKDFITIHSGKFTDLICLASLNFCNLIFCEDIPNYFLIGFTYCRLGYKKDHIYMVTNNQGFLEFGKKFVSEVIKNV